MTKKATSKNNNKNKKKIARKVTKRFYVEDKILAILNEGLEEVEATELNRAVVFSHRCRYCYNNNNNHVRYCSCVGGGGSFARAMKRLLTFNLIECHDKNDTNEMIMSDRSDDDLGMMGTTSVAVAAPRSSVGLLSNDVVKEMNMMKLHDELSEKFP